MILSVIPSLIQIAIVYHLIEMVMMAWISCNAGSAVRAEGWVGGWGGGGWEEKENPPGFSQDPITRNAPGRAGRRIPHEV